MLEIKNVTAGYGKQAVLHHVNAVLKKGTLTSIVGVNGCGKSTLLKAALGLIPTQAGEIRVDGADISSLTRNEIAKKIAYLAQGKNTPDMTVGQMVLHGRFPYLSYPRRYTENDRRIAWKAMETAGISAYAEKPLCALSGGMRQNAYIAMALAQDTDYILLDEPTTYLDIAHQLSLMKTLRSLAESGKGIIAVMHDLPLAFDFSDEIVLVSDGECKRQASPDEICQTPLLREIFGVGVRYVPDQNQYVYDHKTNISYPKETIHESQ